MSTHIDVDGYQIDAMSQRMLFAMTDGEQTAANLETAAGCDHYRQVSYRVEEKLAPAGLVEEIAENPRTFALTEQGEAFVADYDLDATTFDAVRRVAREAEEVAAEAAEAVADLRADLDRIEEESPSRATLQERIDRVFDELYLDEESTLIGEDDDPRWLASYNFGKLDTVANRVTRLEKQVEPLPDADTLEERLAAMEETQQDLVDAVAQLAECINTHGERLDAKAQLDYVQDKDEELNKWLTKLENRVDSIEREINDSSGLFG